jgi:hypothetical protein
MGTLADKGQLGRAEQRAGDIEAIALESGHCRWRQRVHGAPCAERHRPQHLRSPQRVVEPTRKFREIFPLCSTTFWRADRRHNTTSPQGPLLTGASGGSPTIHLLCSSSSSSIVAVLESAGTCSSTLFPVVDATAGEDEFEPWQPSLASRAEAAAKVNSGNHGTEWAHPHRDSRVRLACVTRNCIGARLPGSVPAVASASLPLKQQLSAHLSPPIFILCCRAAVAAPHGRRSRLLPDRPFRLKNFAPIPFSFPFACHQLRPPVLHLLNEPRE